MAGEITFVSAPLPGEPYHYIFTATTYTKISGDGSAAADRDTLDINFGDGNPIDKAPRINGQGVVVGDNIKMNIYQIAHTYIAPYDYVVSIQDPNRIDGIINIQFGQSVNIPILVIIVMGWRSSERSAYWRNSTLKCVGIQTVGKSADCAETW